MFLVWFTGDADIKRDQSEDELLNAHHTIFWIQNNISGHHHFIFRRNHVINIYIYVWKLNQTVLEFDFRAVKFLDWSRFMSASSVNLTKTLVDRGKCQNMFFYIAHIITDKFHLRIKCILLKFHWGMKALTEVHFQC
jgi:hypothetical protein